MPQNWIGQSVKRVEDFRFLTGQGQYVDDIVLPRMCFGVVVMSPHAHARIRSIDATAAKAAPGVLCVLTGSDALRDKLGGMPPLFMPEDRGGPKGYRTLRPALVHDKVRCVGDRVAFIVAETADQARDAADLLDVDYDILPATVSVEDASRPGAPAVHDDNPSNQCCAVAFGDKAAVDSAFAGAARIVSLKLVSNRLNACPIEPRCTLGSYSAADDRYVLYTGSQNPHGVRRMLSANVFHEPETKFQVISPDVGGGFGMKSDAYPEDALVLWASKVCGRPVKWVASRLESFLGDHHGRDQVVTGEMALSKDGRILGVRVRSMHAVGAYVVSAAVAPIVFSMRFVPSLYDVRAFHAMNIGVFTNTAPLSVYRGAGRPEAIFLIERLMDTAAAEMGIDRVEIRRRNLIRPDQMPYTTQAGFVYDSGDFERLLDECLELADWSGYETRRIETERRGLRRGRSVTPLVELSGVYSDQMSLRFDPSGAVTILAGTHSHGQGHATVFTQLVSEWLGVPFESVRYIQGDTDKVHFGRGTYAARSSMIGGCALRMAADSIIAKATPVAAHLLCLQPEDVEFRKGRFVTASGKSVSMTEVARASYQMMGMPPELAVGLEATGSWGAEPPNFPNGCHICEVELDPVTGTVRVDRYTAVDDVGRALNPMICEGQIVGGVAQGIGQALKEQIVYDPESGQLLSGSFMDYALPRAEDMPAFRLKLMEIPCKTNPLGVKGVAESGTIASTAAVMNAVLDALRPLGVKHLDMPATPARVWAALQAAREGVGK
ncbi:MAG TPA: xanthine dehydrogenase family protein molybdopterin-binding subunit [Patescibacteria group bacterium]|nr:xanthine dehydrogenase family protein molybdopterin-binding subunit [Patescibacteria group bacterium]